MSVSGDFTINRGSNSSIKAGDPVITRVGLVGIVSEIAPTYARITSILSTEVHIKVKTAQGGVLGIIENDILYSSNRQALMRYIENDSEIAVGDVVVTAGGSVYPPGLVIGTVVDVFPADNGLALHAVIEPAEDVFRVNSVTAIVAFEGQGITP
jgi:rod shape-determining protein MreC